VNLLVENPPARVVARSPVRALSWFDPREGVAAMIVCSILANEGLPDMFFGIGTARKGGLTKERVINTRPLASVLDFVRAKRLLAAPR